MTHRRGGGQFLDRIVKCQQVICNGIQMECMPIEFCIVEGNPGLGQGFGNLWAPRGRIEALLGGEQHIALPNQQQDSFGLLRYIWRNAHPWIMAPRTHRGHVIWRQHLGHHRTVTGHAIGSPTSRLQQMVRDALFELVVFGPVAFAAGSRNVFIINRTVRVAGTKHADVGLLFLGGRRIAAVAHIARYSVLLMN